MRLGDADDQRACLSAVFPDIKRKQTLRRSELLRITLTKTTEDFKNTFRLRAVGKDVLQVAADTGRRRYTQNAAARRRGRESRTTMMRRQMGDIGAIANVCNTDLQEPADDSASAGRDEDFHAPTRRYYDIRYPWHHRHTATRRYRRITGFPQGDTAGTRNYRHNCGLRQPKTRSNRKTRPQLGVPATHVAQQPRVMGTSASCGAFATPPTFHKSDRLIGTADHTCRTGNTSPALAPLLRTHPVQCAPMCLFNRKWAG